MKYKLCFLFCTFSCSHFNFVLELTAQLEAILAFSSINIVVWKESDNHEATVFSKRAWWFFKQRLEVAFCSLTTKAKKRLSQTHTQSYTLKMDSCWFSCRWVLLTQYLSITAQHTKHFIIPHFNLCARNVVWTYQTAVLERAHVVSPLVVFLGWSINKMPRITSDLDTVISTQHLKEQGRTICIFQKNKRESFMYYLIRLTYFLKS